MPIQGENLQKTFIDEVATDCFEKRGINTEGRNILSERGQRKQVRFRTAKSSNLGIKRLAG